MFSTVGEVQLVMSAYKVWDKISWNVTKHPTMSRKRHQLLISSHHLIQSEFCYKRYTSSVVAWLESGLRAEPVCFLACWGQEWLISLAVVTYWAPRPSCSQLGFVSVVWAMAGTVVSYHHVISHYHHHGDIDNGKRSTKYIDIHL